MAIDSGVISILVLSGEATKEDVAEFGEGIDLVVDSINALLR